MRIGRIEPFSGLGFRVNKGTLEPKHLQNTTQGIFGMVWAGLGMGLAGLGGLGGRGFLGLG